MWWKVMLEEERRKHYHQEVVRSVLVYAPTQLAAAIMASTGRWFHGWQVYAVYKRGCEHAKRCVDVMPAGMPACVERKLAKARGVPTP